MQVKHQPWGMLANLTGPRSEVFTVILLWQKNNINKNNLIPTVLNEMARKYLKVQTVGQFSAAANLLCVTMGLCPMSGRNLSNVEILRVLSPRKIFMPQCHAVFIAQRLSELQTIMTPLMCMCVHTCLLRACATCEVLVQGHSHVYIHKAETVGGKVS